MIDFGPVPSRRLGKNLGINNVPAKICSYSCVYCQLGKATKKRIDRQAYYSPERILKEVRNKVVWS
jgi:wyosine [tRNA(Phe)-imidazoG37] synthetase (radical SAM superfamily)